MKILWGLALYFLITCIGTEYEKVRQDVTDYKFRESGRSFELSQTRGYLAYPVLLGNAKCL